MVKDKNILQADALAFLRNGERSESSVEDLIAACDRLVRSTTEQSSLKAIELGRLFVERSANLDGATPIAQRSLGWALLVGGQYPQARDTYLRARKYVVKNARARASIDRVLVDVYMYLGESAEAQRRGRMALSTFKRLRADADIAKTKVNLANVLHRQDRHRQAYKLYHEAAEYFTDQNAALPAAICHYNEANTLVQLFEFDRAAELYTIARQSFENHQHQLRATGCLYGLAWLHMLEGNFHQALRELTTCEQSYQEAGQEREVILCLLDRAETYLGLNLFFDARDAAVQAETRAKKLGINYEASKAAFFMGKASAALGQGRFARRALERARRGFAAEKNTGFLTAVDFANSQLTRRSDPRQLKAIRRRLGRERLPLWEAICDLELLAANPTDRQTDKRLMANHAVRTVPHLLARHHTIHGDRAAVEGKPARAIGHWRRAADVLEVVRANLPPVDLRASFSRHQTDPYERLIEACASSDPAAAAAWLERYKTSGVWATDHASLREHPERRRAEQSLAALAERLNALSAHLSLDSGRRSMADVFLSSNTRSLLNRLRLDLAEVSRLDTGKADRLEDIQRQLEMASQRATIIQWQLTATDLIAFVHTDRQVRYHRFVDGAAQVREYVGRWRFLVERLPYLAKVPRHTQLADEQRLMRDIGNRLISPLELPRSNRPLLIIPDGSLTNLPWQALSPEDKPLADSHRLVFAPSIRHFLFADRPAVKSDEVRIFAGKTDGLSFTEAEASALSQAASRVETHAPCRRDDWPTESTANIWHYSGHALWRNDNPFYSALLLDDGPLFAADFRIRHNEVNLVTLAACRTGQQSFLPGEESTGLVRSLIEMGARNVIASHWSVEDRPTAEWMTVLYRALSEGDDLADAVHRASLDLREKYPSACHWPAFSLFGAGHGSVLRASKLTKI